MCAGYTDVQGFELEVLKGLEVALRERRVLYVLLEFWPKGMRKAARVDAAEVLRLLHSCGYVLFDTQTIHLRGSGDRPVPSAATFRKPNEARANAEWFRMQDQQRRARFGYWTDMVAVAGGVVDFDRF